MKLSAIKTTALSILLLITGTFHYTVFAQEKKINLKVLSYNIHIGNPPSKPRLTDLKGIAKVINESKADLIALQEVDVFTNRSGKDLDQAKELARLTKRDYYFVKAIDHDGGEYGVAILSKFPIVKKESHPLPIAEGVDNEPRAIAIVTVEIDKGILLDFASTHFDLSPQTRKLQSAYIINLAKQRNNPLLIGGDFNATPDSEEILLLDSYFKRSKIHDGFTFPVTAPTQEIDYILFSPESQFKILQHQVIQEHYASDHLPVLVKLEYSMATK